jgi:hypothetical protein
MKSSLIFLKLVFREADLGKLLEHSYLEHLQAVEQM